MLHNERHQVGYTENKKYAKQETKLTKHLQSPTGSVNITTRLFSEDKAQHRKSARYAVGKRNINSNVIQSTSSHFTANYASTVAFTSRSFTQLLAWGLIRHQIKGVLPWCWDEVTRRNLQIIRLHIWHTKMFKKFLDCTCILSPKNLTYFSLVVLLEIDGCRWQQQ